MAAVGTASQQLTYRLLCVASSSHGNCSATALGQGQPNYHPTPTSPATGRDSKVNAARILLIVEPPQILISPLIHKRTLVYLTFINPSGSISPPCSTFFPFSLHIQHIRHHHGGLHYIRQVTGKQRTQLLTQSQASSTIISNTANVSCICSRASGTQAHVSSSCKNTSIFHRVERSSPSTSGLMAPMVSAQNPR